MGFFGAYMYAEGRWSDVDMDDEVSTPAEPWMFVLIYDGDIGTVRYAPSGEAAGEAFVGFTPRVYFDDENASRPTDPARESHGLAAWARAVVGSEVDASQVASFLASDDSDDSDGVVETHLAELLTYLGLTLPADLAPN